MNINDPRAAVDGFACVDDFAHAELCADRLLANKYDNTETRALWQSALISIRRAMANSQSMYTIEGGATAKPFNRNEAKQHLPENLHDVFADILEMADKCVAHRQPKEGRRTIEIAERDATGNIDLRGRQMLPSNEQRKALKQITQALKHAALQATATAMQPPNKQFS